MQVLAPKEDVILWEMIDVVKCHSNNFTLQTTQKKSTTTHYIPVGDNET